MAASQQERSEGDSNQARGRRLRRHTLSLGLFSITLIGSVVVQLSYSLDRVRNALLCSKAHPRKIPP